MARRSPATRGVSPAIGVVLLTAVTVVLAAGIAAAALAVAPPADVSAGPTSISACATTDGRVTLRHRGGAPLAVDDLRVRVTVDGQPLAHQPPVPFVGAPGFRGAPTGPFNAASDARWTVGESAGFVVAGTNHPSPSRGSTVTVVVYENGREVASVETRTADCTPTRISAPRVSTFSRRATDGIRPRLRPSPCRRRVSPPRARARRS